MLVIVDYGLGNLGSIQNMLKKISVLAIISSDKEVISKATKLILPGVGSFDYGMGQLTQLGLVDVLKQKVIVEKTPILGICLGVQLFTQKSEEGKMSGLNFIEGETVKKVDYIANTYDYHTIWLSSFWPPTISQQQVLNHLAAENIIKIIDALIIGRL